MNKLKFDYSDILEVDSDTYAIWTPRILVIEKSALNTVKHLSNTVDVDNSDLVEAYCKERVFIELLGDSLSKSILSYHQEMIAQYEGGLKYGLD